MKRGATAMEKAYMAKVASLGCQLCIFLEYGATPAEVHHCRTKHGWGRSNHMDTIGLCPEHHRGQPGGIHDFGRQEFEDHYGISEMQLLDVVKQKTASARD